MAPEIDYSYINHMNLSDFRIKQAQQAQAFVNQIPLKMPVVPQDVSVSQSSEYITTKTGETRETTINTSSWQDVYGRNHEYSVKSNGIMNYSIYEDDQLISELTAYANGLGGLSCVEYSEYGDDGYVQKGTFDYPDGYLKYEAKTGDGYEFYIQDKNGDHTLSMDDEPSVFQYDALGNQVGQAFTNWDENLNGIKDDGTVTVVREFNAFGEQLSEKFGVVQSQYYDNGNPREIVFTSSEMQVTQSYNEEGTQSLTEIDNVDAFLGMNFLGKAGYDGRIDFTIGSMK